MVKAKDEKIESITTEVKTVETPALEPIEIGKNPFMVIYHKKDGANENKIEAVNNPLT